MIFAFVANVILVTVMDKQKREIVMTYEYAL